MNANESVLADAYGNLSAAPTAEETDALGPATGSLPVFR